VPRDLPIGNACLLVNFDANYQLRDLYFPHIGNENHTSGHPFRFGFWVDGTFRWIDDPRWQRDLRYEPHTLVTAVTLRHPDLPIEIRSRDTVDFHENLYLRRLRVANTSDRAIEVRVFFHHDFHIYENDVGDTAYYEPQRKVIFHYKDLRWFLINGYRGPSDHGVDQFACGQKEVRGLQGTWRDAEDGILSGNCVAQGSVDSTIGLHLALDPRATGELYYWIAAGERFDDVTGINRRVLEHGPATILDRDEHYWQLWSASGHHEFDGLTEDVAELFVRSLLTVQTQIDGDGGILAANDFDVTRFNSDTYSYVWPRDGAIAAVALAGAGYSVPVRQFLSFVGRLLTKEGFLLHKYNPDGSLASSWHPWYADGQRELPIQEDETGLVLWAFWEYFERFPEVEFIKPFYRETIVHAADFLVNYRDPRTGLTMPSWDLWEERRGVLSWTVSSVWAGLTAAGRFASAFGEDELAGRYRAAAAELRRAADTYLWREEDGRFARRVELHENGDVAVDRTLDASVAGLFLFGMYDADDPRIVKTMEQVRERLWVKTDVGGVARYEGDTYQQVASDTKAVPGNPWFVCTLWLARWIVARARTEEDLAPALDLLRWVARRALPSGVLAEQVHPYTGEPLSVSPLTWSHAEVVQTAVDFLDKIGDLRRCAVCGHRPFDRSLERVQALRRLAEGNHD
jgi:GH15 family glucan-1,4-alpha-glucosidase